MLYTNLQIFFNQDCEKNAITNCKISAIAVSEIVPFRYLARTVCKLRNKCVPKLFHRKYSFISKNVSPKAHFIACCVKGQKENDVTHGIDHHRCPHDSFGYCFMVGCDGIIHFVARPFCSTLLRTTKVILLALSVLGLKRCLCSLFEAKLIKRKELLNRLMLVPEFYDHLTISVGNSFFVGVCQNGEMKSPETWFNFHLFRAHL